MSNIPHPAHRFTLMTKPQDPANDPEPRWPALLALLAVGALDYALPKSLLLVPRWLPILVVVLLLVPTVISYKSNHHFLNWVLGHVVAGVVSTFLVIALGRLLYGLPRHLEEPTRMLWSAVSLWLSNMLIFALWYWRLDAGGPHARDLRSGHTNGAFLFPQMTLDPTQKREMDADTWSPGFVDYLFIAFNTSTAFSPTDTAALSPWAKILMMLQAMISLTVIALLAARAVNIL